MSLKKTVAILAAVGALAAISVPAMALENEFHGIYNFNFNGSNVQSSASADIQVGGTPEKRQMNNYFEQRARLFYTAKVSDDLKFVTGLEIDHRYGDANADLDTDSINIEVKHVYLDFNLGSSFNAKTGLQAYQDTIKGLFISADVPAVITTTKLGAYTLGIGFSRFDDDFNGTTVTRLGDKNKDLFILDNTFAITKDTKIAASYYFLADYATGTTGYAASNTPNGSNILELANADAAILLNTFALSGESKVGPATLSGFAAMQAGHQKAAGTQVRRYFHGWAANVAAKLAVGPGTARTAFLFTSGNNSTDPGSYKGWVTSSVNTYNEGNMQILARSTANSPSTTDQYVRRNVTNIALLTLGYDANLTDKIFLNGNLGFAWTPASNREFMGTGAAGTAHTNRNSGDFMGSEINLETGYKVSPNLTLKATGAYMLLGAVYKDTSSNSLTENPENPYSMRLHAQFKF